jgi:DNA-binding transcriptional ArsR family regulator
MSINSGFPDYELQDRLVVTDRAQLKAMSHPLRTTVLDLLLERAATVTELAASVGRPKSTVAHHVGVLVDAGLLRVVRTRRVRAIEERYYGRTARIVYVGPVSPELVDPPPWTNALTDAAIESGPAHQADTMRAIRRHARISAERAGQFWARVEELVTEFTQLPRSGDTVHGLVVGLYPTEHPSLPDPADQAR